MLSLYSYIDYVKEYTADKTTTITLTFADYREVTGLMIYNSKFYDRAFIDVKRIEFDCRSADGKFDGTAYIDNLAFNWDFYRNEYADAMRPGRQRGGDLYAHAGQGDPHYDRIAGNQAGGPAAHR